LLFPIKNTQLTSTLQIVTFVCFQKEQLEEQHMKHKVYALLLVISAVFLVVTLFVYLFIYLQTLHGKILICLVSSLLVSHLLLAVVQFDGNVYEIETDNFIYIGNWIAMHNCSADK